MTRERWILLAAALALVAYIGADWAGRRGRHTDLYAPEKQPAPVEQEPLIRAHILADGYSRLCQPEDHHAGYTYTPHRYPRSVGGDVTTLIHHGYSSMRIPNVQDVQWLISPPSEVAW